MASVEVSSTRVKFFPTKFVFNDFLFDQFQTQVDDKEIVAQEERVKEARDRLASAIKALSWDFAILRHDLDKTATSQPDLQYILCTQEPQLWITWHMKQQTNQESE